MIGEILVVFVLLALVLAGWGMECGHRRRNRGVVEAKPAPSNKPAWGWHPHPPEKKAPKREKRRRTPVGDGRHGRMHAWDVVSLNGRWGGRVRFVAVHDMDWMPGEALDAVHVGCGRPFDVVINAASGSVWFECDCGARGVPRAREDAPVYLEVPDA